MREIFEQLYFLKISIKDDQVSITKKNNYLKFFYHFGSYYLSFLNGVLFILDKKVLYKEAVNVDFQIEPMQKTLSLFFFLVIFILTLTRDLSLNNSKNHDKLKIYHFFFFIDVKTIKNKFKMNEKYSQYLSQANFNNEKALKKIFLFYDFVFFFFFSGIAYFKLRSVEMNFIFLVKIILYIHLYTISNFCFQVLVFELFKQVFSLSYISLRIKNEIDKLILIIKSIGKKNISSKKILQRRKIFQVQIRLKKVFKNYNEILIEREKLKKQNANFSSCFIISIFSIFFFLVIIVFYRKYNIVSTIFSFTLYITMLIFFMLPVVSLNVNQNQKNKSFVQIACSSYNVINFFKPNSDVFNILVLNNDKNNFLFDIYGLVKYNLHFYLLFILESMSLVFLLYNAFKI